MASNQNIPEVPIWSAFPADKAAAFATRSRFSMHMYWTPGSISSKRIYMVNETETKPNSPAVKGKEYQYLYGWLT